MEAKITRENLVQNYSTYEKELKELKAKEYSYQVTRPVNPFGHVRDMDFEDLVKCHALVHDAVRNTEESVKALGLTGDEFKEKKVQFQGFPVSKWDDDFKTRVQELRDKTRVKKLETAVATFKRHFSEDDKFAMDMAALEL